MWQTTQSNLVTVPAGVADRLCDQVRLNSGTMARRMPWVPVWQSMQLAFTWSDPLMWVVVFTTQVPRLPVVQL